MTDEELEKIKLLGPCPTCGNKLVSVRQASKRWWYVGCYCVNKYQCERQFVDECVAKWNTYVRRCRNVKSDKSD